MCHTNKRQRLTARHVMEAKVTVVGPVGQQRDAVPALVADVVVRMRLAKSPGVGPRTAGISSNLGALRGPDSIDVCWNTM